MKINDIDFDIKNIEITNNYNQINFGFQQMNVPGKKEIRITAQTSSSNTAKLSDWIEKSAHLPYKYDTYYNDAFIAGIFPINISFNSHNIDVTFSADYINHNMNQKEIRKIKLKRINNISNEN